MLTNGRSSSCLMRCADEAAEPVVGVQHVGRRVVLEVVDHGIAELVDHRRQLLLGQVVRAGGDVHDTMARLDLHDLGQARVAMARVYVVHSTPAWASADTSSRTYTFMPPLSPEPGWAGATCGAKARRRVARRCETLPN